MIPRKAAAAPACGDTSVGAVRPDPPIAGHGKARRNLLAAWALMRSLPLACARPLRADINATAHRAARSTGVVHEFARVRGGCPRVHPPHAIRHDRTTTQPAARPVAGSIADTAPPKLVSTSRPPTSAASVTTSLWATRQADRPVGLEREGLDLGLDEHVGEARRPEDREQRRRRAVRPAQLAAPAVEPVRRGSRTSRRAGRRRPRPAPAGSS